MRERMKADSFESGLMHKFRDARADAIWRIISTIGSAKDQIVFLVGRSEHRAIAILLRSMFFEHLKRPFRYREPSWLL